MPTHFLPYEVSHPDGFPKGFFQSPDGLYCTIPRRKNVIQRRQRISDPIWARRHTRGGLLVLDNPQLPSTGLHANRHGPVHEIARTLYLLGISIEQDCLFDVEQWVALVEPTARSGWVRREETAA